MQASTSAAMRVPGSLTEDAFDDLEDSFVTPALPQKAPVESLSSHSASDSIAFWASCTQDLFIFAFVLFVVPFIAGRLVRAPPLKKADELEFAAPSQQPRKRAAVNLGQLMQAARSGDDAQWRSSLLAIPSPTHAADTFGCTALHVAADAGCVDMVKVLLEAGADVDVRDTWEETPLHFAARKGSSETCQVLLAKGAELDAVNSNGVTPLVASAKAGNESVCQFLLDRGATCQGLSDDDVPPLLLSLMLHNMILPSSEKQQEDEEQ